MVTISMEIQLLFAGMIFLIGLVGFLVRRNVIYMLLSIEIMLNSAGTGICNCRITLDADRRTGDVYFHSDGFSR